MRQWTVAASVLYLLSTPPLAAQAPGGGQERSHVVRPGDTLSDLARLYLNDALLWPEIFSRNKDAIAEPDWIYPSQRILIPGPDHVEAEGPEVVAGGAPMPSRTVFFQGERSRMDPVSSVMQQGLPDEMPIFGPGVFYAAGILAPDSVVIPVGRIGELVSPTALQRDIDKQIHPFDRVYLSTGSDMRPGDRVLFMRPDREVRSHGRIFVSTGTGRVRDEVDGRATVEIDRMFDRVSPGDLVFPMPVFAVPSSGVRPLPATGWEGRLLAFATAQSLPSREDVAYIDLGREEGVAEGDEFVAYLPATEAGSGSRPAMDLATPQVIRAGARTSAVRVVSMQQPMLREGLPVRLVAKMPRDATSTNWKEGS